MRSWRRSEGKQTGQNTRGHRPAAGHMISNLQSSNGQSDGGDRHDVITDQLLDLWEAADDCLGGERHAVTLQLIHVSFFSLSLQLLEAEGRCKMKFFLSAPSLSPVPVEVGFHDNYRLAVHRGVVTGAVGSRAALRRKLHVGVVVERRTHEVGEVVEPTAPQLEHTHTHTRD